jgi:hypothetical protein
MKTRRSPLTYSTVPTATKGKTINRTDVEVSADGETFSLAFLGGVTWNCNEEELRALLD